MIFVKVFYKKIFCDFEVWFSFLQYFSRMIETEEGYLLKAERYRVLLCSAPEMTNYKIVRKTCAGNK